jgi:O-succinylbenzoic acid--CoA ligase
VVFTSGSSGAAKAVRLLESNWEAAGTNSSAYFGYGPGDRWLLSLPLHHVSGLSIVFRALCSGGSVLISSDLRDLCKVEFASLVPTQLARLDDYGRVRTLVIGGGGLSESLTTRVAEWPVVRTYGMTETAAVAASAPLADGLGALHPLPGVEFQIGDRGRIEVRGEQVSPGYVGQPPRRPEEWLITADRGRIHPDGSIEVLGRADRIINSGGAKVDPAAVEGVIRAQPGIEDVAVFGVPDPEWGELVGAAYVGSAETAELQTVVAQALGREAVPRRIRRVSHLPRTELGKLDYPALIDLSE